MYLKEVNTIKIENEKELDVMERCMHILQCVQFRGERKVEMEISMIGIAICNYKLAQRKGNVFNEVQIE